MTFEDVYTVSGYSILALLLVVLAVEMVRDHRRAKREREERNNQVTIRMASVTLPLPKDARITTVRASNGRDGTPGVQVLQGDGVWSKYWMAPDAPKPLPRTVPKPSPDPPRKRRPKR